MKIRFLILAYVLFNVSCVTSQEYIGAGNDTGITTYASDQAASTNWLEAANAQNTINGNGLVGKQMEASRFLAQATMGYDKNDIQSVTDTGIESWIDDQLSLAITYITPEQDHAWLAIIDTMTLAGYSSEEIGFRPRWNAFNYGWWHVTMTHQDQLRHRMAYALSQIFVISMNSDLEGYGDGLATYYDLLLDGAFGNFEDLLRNVTLSPMMGFYLSSLNNPKTNLTQNTRPDENYAREIMQLFTIGLYELNTDGTRQLDANGDPIPTYGQDEIKEFAKIFTGLGVGGSLPAGIPEDYNNGSIFFGKSLWTADVTVPMIMYDEWHEPGTKNLLNGYTVPAGQTGMQDIDSAINHLFNHPNVGPFIAYRLIQRLVKSNPSPRYVERVANVFNDNGSGVRGDMGAVAKAILMDDEARECGYLTSDVNSRLREPFVRYTQFCRMSDKINTGDKYWNIGYGFYESTNQSVLSAPTVFNFYLPDHAPGGDIFNADLTAPEYKLHDARTSVGYVNEVYNWNVWWGALMYTWDDLGDSYTTRDITQIKTYARDAESLINELDLKYTHGRLSSETRAVIRSTIDQIPQSQWYDWEEYRVYLATYLLLISPDYAVMR